MALLFNKRGSAMHQRTTNLFMFCLISFIVLISCPYRLILIRGDSMHPTYKNGDIVLATRKFEIQKNDIVVAKDEYGEFIIKRVKYIPGDFYYFYLIYSDKPEKVFINNDSYNSIKNYKNLNIKLFETELEKNQYFLIGDNSNHSDDSRRFGPVYKEDIIYKVIR